MEESKFWSFLGISLAVMAFYNPKMRTTELVLIGIIIILVCYTISYVWYKIQNSHHKWVDALFFFFSKTKLPYIVVDKTVVYKIINEKEATYDLCCNLKSRKNESDFCYKGRYNWDQEDDIDVSVSGDGGKFTYACSEELKWSNVDIKPDGRFVHRNEKVNVKLSLRNLHISKLSKHSYLSCKMTEKVKHLVLNAVVDSKLKPSEEAEFIVQNPLGEEVSRETVRYDTSTNSYKISISHPRRGRKYIIKWDYKK